MPNMLRMKSTMARATGILMKTMQPDQENPNRDREDSKQASKPTSKQTNKEKSKQTAS